MTVAIVQCLDYGGPGLYLLDTVILVFSLSVWKEERGREREYLAFHSLVHIQQSP